MKSRKPPGILMGALMGTLLTSPLIALFFLAWRLFGLPFVPFTVFDWTSRKLPGPVITSGIDSMVKLIRSLHLGDTATVAKTAEQVMATAGFLVAGMLAVAALFAILRVWRGRSYGAGIVVGAVAGAMAVLIAQSLNQLAPDSVIAGLWILSAFLVWGLASGWAHRRLSRIGAATATAEPADAEVERLDRRRFLVRLGGATAVITVVGAVVGTLVGSKRGRETVQVARRSENVPLPNAGASVAPAPGTRPELTPLEDHYRIDINTTPPVIREADWRLRIAGLVERPLELTLEDIRRYEAMEQFITLACISNPIAGDLIGTARWKGVSLQRLLPDWKLKSGATHLKIQSADGFHEVLALEVVRADPRVMLAYEWDGVPLLIEHGFPLRVYIPDRYGMKQPKWIESIEAIDHLEDGYWVTRGWDREARMKATAVIDTIAVDMMIVQADQNTRIPVGGIAHAGARGISKVEVRVDDGEWREAQLRTPLSDLTWVVWRYEWPFEKGKHTLTVRCFDGSGVPQIVEEAPPHPSGASGLHSQSAML